MSADLNSVTIVGRLTRDAEQRQAGETSIQSMRLAYSTRKKTAGEWGDVSGYIDVTLFGREGLAQYLTKGVRIGVTGRLAWREFTTQAGEKKQTTEIGGPRPPGVIVHCGPRPRCGHSARPRARC